MRVRAEVGDPTEAAIGKRFPIALVMEYMYRRECKGIMIITTRGLQLGTKSNASCLLEQRNRVKQGMRINIRDSERNQAHSLFYLASETEVHCFA